MEDLVAKLQRHADELYSARGFNKPAHAMLLAADEIVKLRAAVAAEREACAKECEKIERWHSKWWTLPLAARRCAAAIRASAVAVEKTRSKQ
jgi:hypothetical protein